MPLVRALEVAELKEPAERCLELESLAELPAAEGDPPALMEDRPLQPLHDPGRPGMTDTVRQLIDEIGAGEDRRTAVVKKKLDSLRASAADLTLRRDRTYVDKLDRVITEERWREMDGEWAKELTGVREEVTRLEGALLTRGADAREAFELLEQASQLYLRQPHEEQARGLKILVSNCKLTGGTVEPNYRKPFALVAEGLQSSTWYRRRDLNPHEV